MWAGGGGAGSRFRSSGQGGNREGNQFDGVDGVGVVGGAIEFAIAGGVDGALVWDPGLGLGVFWWGEVDREWKEGKR